MTRERDKGKRQYSIQKLDVSNGHATKKNLPPTRLVQRICYRLTGGFALLSCPAEATLTPRGMRHGNHIVGSVSTAKTALGKGRNDSGITLTIPFSSILRVLLNERHGPEDFRERHSFWQL